MEDSEDFFISQPATYNSNTQKQRQDRPLFTQQSLYQEQQEQPKYKWRQQQCRNDEVIDEELLAKISQLHESLRNKKLLQFQLIQTKIMKDENRKDSIAIREQIQKLKIQSIEVEIESRSNQQDIQQLRREIQQQKAKNRKHLKKIEETNYAIMKTKQKREQTIQKNQFKENINTENRFISVEKMRLVAENQSKDQIIAQIKLIIAEMKSKIAKKQQQHKQLEEQQQNLLEEIKKEQKEEKKRQKNKVTITQPTSKRNTVDKKTNLSLCHHQQSTQHEVSRSTASIKQDFKSNKRSDQSCQSLAKPKKVIKNDQRSVAGSTKTKKKDKIQCIR